MKENFFLGLILIASLTVSYMLNHFGLIHQNEMIVASSLLLMLILSFFLLKMSIKYLTNKLYKNIFYAFTIVLNFLLPIYIYKLKSERIYFIILTMGLVINNLFLFYFSKLLKNVK